MIHQIIEWVVMNVKTNQVFNGVIGAGILSTVVLSWKTVLNWIRNAIARYLTVSWRVTNEHETLYNNFVGWTKKANMYKSSRRQVVTENQDVTEHIPSSGFEISKKDNITVQADNDTYFFWYKCLPVVMRSSYKPRDNSEKFIKEIVLTFYFRGTNFLKNIQVEFSKHLVEVKDSKKLTVVRWFSPSTYVDNNTSYELKRSLDKVYLPKGIKEDLLMDLLAFKNMKAKYIEHGVAYKRAYLIAGNPGTGKTSLIKAIASYLDVPKLQIMDVGSLQGRFTEAYANCSTPAVIAIEDIDASNVDTKVRSNSENPLDNKSSLSLSSLLNSLDGLVTKNNAIVVMTTNHLDKLDPALVRPGRVDKIIHLDYLTYEEGIEMMEFYGWDKDKSVKLIDDTFEKKEGQYLVPAAIQELNFKLAFQNIYNETKANFVDNVPDAKIQSTQVQ